MQQATRLLTRDDMAGKRQVFPCADYKGIWEEQIYTAPITNLTQHGSEWSFS
jgi:hypothetical protein